MDLRGRRSRSRSRLIREIRNYAENNIIIIITTHRSTVGGEGVEKSVYCFPRKRDNRVCYHAVESALPRARHFRHRSGASPSVQPPSFRGLPQRSSRKNRHLPTRNDRPNTVSAALISSTFCETSAQYRRK